MVTFEDMLANYPHRKHFLQTVNLPAFAPPGRSFLYMKTHKAACTTVLATLMKHLARAKGIEEEISMASVHTPPKSVLLTGPRGLGERKVVAAVNDASVFKFTVIREPISRTVSAWADKIDKDDKQKGKLMKYLGRPADGEMTLSQFIDILARDAGARDVDRHWRPQRLEISYDQIPFDYIGTVENMGPAMAHITETIFGPDAAGEIEDTRRSLGHATKSKDLRAELSAQDLRNLEAAFGPDLEMYEAVTKRLGEAA